MIYHVTYLSDELKVHGFLALPNQYSYPDFSHMFIQTKQRSSSIMNQESIGAKTFPALLFCRGGIGRFGRVKTAWMEAFASQGFIVFAPTYRGNEGSEGRDTFGGDDRNDVHIAYQILSSLPFVDKDHISIMGFSRGSINATLTAIEMPQTQSLVLWSGVADLEKTYEERIDLRKMLKRVIGGTPTKLPNEYSHRSPIKLAKHIHCPVLIVHGTQDTQVLYSHGEAMYHTLKSYKKEVEFYSYEALEHHFPLPIHEQAVKRMSEWMLKI